MFTNIDNNHRDTASFKIITHKEKREFFGEYDRIITNKSYFFFTFIIYVWINAVKS